MRRDVELAGGTGRRFVGDGLDGIGAGRTRTTGPGGRVAVAERPAPTAGGAIGPRASAAAPMAAHPILAFTPPRPGRNPLLGVVLAAGLGLALWALLVLALVTAI